MQTSQDEDFVVFAEAAMRDLRRTAYLLCGDWGYAEDAVQAGLIKVYVKWRRLNHERNVWAYARRAVVTSLIDHSRRHFRTREERVAEVPETCYDDATSEVDDRLLVEEALKALPRRQRAVVVLRYLDDLDVQETAFVLKCPTGTVTASTSRALTFLRKYLTERGFVRSAEKELR